MTELAKPPFGEPCNGCGVCCKRLPCVFARHLLKAFEAPCPALEFDGKKYRCGLLTNASRHIYGTQDKPWVDRPIEQLLRASGGWSGVCDSGPDA